jgi:endothelin-converting enzyme
MPPQTVNAFYRPGLNEIIIPAAMLQPPLFQMDADDAVNYGSIGAVIGHELGHGFDERGRNFDGAGARRDWWTPQDAHAFQQQCALLVEQFSGYRSIDGMRVNGSLTLGENIGDLSGLALAYRAYRISLKGKTPAVIDGFTGDQRFFLGWAQVWRTVLRDEYLRQWLLWMPHAPPEYRANGPVRNIDAFYAAFNVKPGDKLYVDPGKRVRIW